MPADAHRLAIRALALAGAAVLLTACGGSSSSSEAGSNSQSESTPSAAHATLLTVPADVCTLVTAAEASTADGTTLVSATGFSIPGACIYSSADSNNSASVFVYAIAESDTSSAASLQPDALASIFAGRYGITNAHPVNGIGDKAFEYTATSVSGNSPGIAIFIVKANIVMFIIMSPSTDSTQIETLGRNAAGRLTS